MKILIVCPVLTINYAWFKSFFRFWEYQRKFTDRVFGLYMPSRKPPSLVDNKGVAIAEDGGFDYILRMDDDVWDIPNDGLDKLLQADKEYISASAYASGFPFQLCALLRTDPKDTLLSVVEKEGSKLREVDGEGIQPCDLTSFSFVLWKTSLFKDLPRPLFEVKDSPPHDSLFCQKLLDAGKQPFVHMDVKVTHRGVNEMNRNYLYMSEMPYRVNSGDVTYIDERGRHLQYLEDNVGHQPDEIIIG